MTFELDAWTQLFVVDLAETGWVLLLPALPFAVASILCAWRAVKSERHLPWLLGAILAGVTATPVLYYGFVLGVARDYDRLALARELGVPPIPPHEVLCIR